MKEVIARQIEPVHGEEAWKITDEDIVRCRECLYWEDERVCLYWQISPYEEPLSKQDDFCSYAKKRVRK